MDSQHVMRTRALTRQKPGQKVLSLETVREFFSKEQYNSHTSETSKKSFYEVTVKKGLIRQKNSWKLTTRTVSSVNSKLFFFPGL